MAPSGYHAAEDRIPSATTVSDAVVTAELVSLWEANYRAYGVRKLWKAARRAGIDIGRDQTGRLMRSAGIEGATRSKRVKTTRPNPTAARHPDLVKREFTATAPSRHWVTDLTFVPTWAGGARRICARKWCWTRSRWHGGVAAPTIRTCGVASTG